MHRRSPWPPLLSLLAVLSFPSAADPPASVLRPDILYTRRGEFVRVMPMRPLTRDAHAQQFAYEPLGIEIAVVGQEVESDNTVHFVKVLDARTGHEMERLTQAVPTEDDGGGFRLVGWSATGKHLLMQRYAPDDTRETNQFVSWDVSVGTPTIHEIDLTSALPPGSRATYAQDHVSPRGRWVLFEQKYALRGEDGKFGPEQTAYLLYDPERGTFRAIAVPDKTWGVGWADVGHLRVHCEGPDRQLDLSQDIVTGQTVPYSDVPTPALASAHYPDLTLDVEQRLQTDTKTDAKSGGRINSHILWIRRTPPGRLALGVAAAGLTAGDAAPQAAWSPTGKQIAFLAHGDLCVTDLAEPGPLPEEKLALGLPLTCPEERAVAQSDLKQIGLGLIQYTQDFDETYPPAGNIDERIDPYIKNRSVFGVGSSHWVYLAPNDLSFAAMEAPWQVVVGTLDTPCAHNILYADGHVKSFPRGREAAP